MHKLGSSHGRQELQTEGLPFPHICWFLCVCSLFAVPLIVLCVCCVCVVFVCLFVYLLCSAPRSLLLPMPIYSCWVNLQDWNWNTDAAVEHQQVQQEDNWMVYNRTSFVVLIVYTNRDAPSSSASSGVRSTSDQQPCACRIESSKVADQLASTSSTVHDFRWFRFQCLVLRWWW
jgi:hypothetical protein